jgi:hypothetical protein
MPRGREHGDVIVTVANVIKAGFAVTCYQSVTLGFTSEIHAVIRRNNVVEDVQV